MALREELERAGNWCFRWRSYLPLVLIFLFLIALKTVRYPYDAEWPDRAWEFFCLSVSLFGLAVRGYAVAWAPRGSSGGNVEEERGRRLDTTRLCFFFF